MSLLELLRRAPDPRAKNTRFRIGPVLSIVAMALLGGARQISEIARFATRLKPAQRAELGLPIKKGTRRFYEVPSYDVFYDVLTRMDPEPFAALLSGWLGAQAGALPGALALDGKMIREIIGMVSLVDVEDGSPVAMEVIDQKENTDRCEQKVAQELLGAVPCLDGKTATDPLHCQKQTARIIVEKGGEYFLQIKANQPTLLQYARHRPEAPPFCPDPRRTWARRRARRVGQASRAEPMATGFCGSRAIVRIRSTRTEKKSGKTSTEDRYYLSSQEPGERTPEAWIQLSRSHWAGVENRNHWRRDASLGEDRTRLRNGHALINLALLRSLNLRLLSGDGSDEWLPAKKESLATNPASALALIQAKL